MYLDPHSHSSRCVRPELELILLGVLQECFLELLRLVVERCFGHLRNLKPNKTNIIVLVHSDCYERIPRAGGL